MIKASLETFYHWRKTDELAAATVCAAVVELGRAGATGDTEVGDHVLGSLAIVVCFVCI